MPRTRLAGLVGLAAAAGFAYAQDLPDLKEGLWESTTTIEGPTSASAPMVSSMCTNNAINQRLHENLHKNANRPCKDVHSERHGATITTEVECNFSGRVTRSKIIVTLTDTTAYRTETRKEDNTVESVIESKYLGACPAGVEVGDVMGSDGKKMMNVLAPDGSLKLPDRP